MVRGEGRSVGIVGAGVLGLALALFLSKKGFRVSLMEKDEKIGGLLLPWRIGEYTWDRFYHVILQSDRYLMNLLDRLNLGDSINWHFTKTGFFVGKRFYSMSNLREFLGFPPLGLLSKLRLALTIFYASRIKSYRRLEKISCLEWLLKFSGERTVRKIWEPLLRSKLGENYKIASASFIWATIARMYRARRSGSKQELFGYVNGGYATILERFQKQLKMVGVETYAGLAVTKVLQNDDRVVIETDRQGSMEFDDVILTIPCPQIADLCYQLSASEKERMRRVTYLSLICGSVLLKKSLRGYYYTNIVDPSIPFTGIVEMTALVNRGLFGGNSLVYLPRYVTETDPFWQKKDEEIRSAFLTALRAMYPDLQEEDCVDFKISRVREIMPLITLNYSRDLLPSCRTSLKNVFVVNSAQIVDGTWNVNELVGHANRKAADIAKLVGRSEV